tara:strand:- start:978 stop:1472 length:495 start_codon:yes stop_codon:yes gene_type:complete
MFEAILVSLGDGQSYRDVKVLEDNDLDKYGIHRYFEEYTGCFFVDKKSIILHHWNFKLIKISGERLTGPNCKDIERIVLSSELIYQNIKIIPSENWAHLQIPLFFVKRNGESGQFAFSCDQGTFITHDSNVASMIAPDPRKSGITFSYNKKSIIKSSVQGNIKR